MIIKNAEVFCEDNQFHWGDVFIQDGLFVNSVQEEDSVIDASGLYAVPGLTDIHFHGCAGYDFCDASLEAVQAMAEYQAEHGITSICPATMTLPEEELEKIMQTAEVYESISGADFCGIHMEGPFLSAKRKGAQHESYLQKPNLKVFQKLQKLSGGKIKLVSLAPELTDAMDFIEAVKEQVMVSLAHTDADYETAKEALEKGAGHVTHLYNAMPPLHHRNPGVIGAARDQENCRVEIICDGMHIHPSVIRATFELFGDNRIVMISDSMRATGMPDGVYTLGGQEVEVCGRKAVLKSDGSLAGSVTNLMDCVRYAVLQAGIPLESAIKAAAVNSAKAIGIYDKYGSITFGKAANLVLLNQKLEIQAVILRGELYKCNW
ncbi:N-acetylglucosamine-6-phosphate deacetylase [Anaeromicropila populeti]|uniref:N-acetylglucosamine-6-phosphate deacetylase n=1 Tax=Anaeromicropila populeti TaxID=37658 RepID=A0A1I6IFU5_9FIRM|nr:N-acetylglucosamine-6-phosphate deacetylase [Anaeromicropila populeti]SFR65635.1 N-acetylglucosamine-6-phosphate deacetylase [Anaeromicropila populeti]